MIWGFQHAQNYGISDTVVPSLRFVNKRHTS
nr:MAG TPA: hypothetical protein [Caudoviricetes sp.]